MKQYEMKPRAARAMKSHGVFRCDGCGAEKLVNSPITGVAFARLRNCYAYGHRACGPRRFERIPNASHFYVTLPAPRGPLHADYFAGRA